MYKVFYHGTKKSDYNLTISASRSNYSSWGLGRKSHEISLHLGKCHISLTKYSHESNGKH